MNSTTRLRQIAASIASAARPWVASDAEATEFANNFVSAMSDDRNEAFATAYELLTYRVKQGWITCGDIAAAGLCVARRWHQETADTFAPSELQA